MKRGTRSRRRHGRRVRRGVRRGQDRLSPRPRTKPQASTATVHRAAQRSAPPPARMGEAQHRAAEHRAPAGRISRPRAKQARERTHAESPTPGRPVDGRRRRALRRPSAFCGRFERGALRRRFKISSSALHRHFGEYVPDKARPGYRVGEGPRAALRQPPPQPHPHPFKPSRVRCSGPSSGGRAVVEAHQHF